MSVTYKLNLKFVNDNDETFNMTFNGVDSGVTKAKVQAFADKYFQVSGDRNLESANLVKTDTEELVPGF